MLRKLKRQIPGEPLAAQYRGPGRGPAVEKHCIIIIAKLLTMIRKTKIQCQFLCLHIKTDVRTSGE